MSIFSKSRVISLPPPSQPSDLEGWISRRAKLTEAQERRAENLLRCLIQSSLSKYNLGGSAPALPAGHCILVPGQVEDDASIKTGASKVKTNLDLLRTTRAANPNAVIIYKPHPDVEAGLRTGEIEAEGLADVIATDTDPAALFDKVDELWTMTSLMGFEALLRGVKVTTLGVPFYAGWGLTQDLAKTPERRQARPQMLGLVHAALVDYPRYCDPVTGLPCPVEVAVRRLQSGEIPHPGVANRMLSKLQGLLTTYAHLWR